jgi:hypothetical protein
MMYHQSGEETSYYESTHYAVQNLSRADSVIATPSLEPYGIDMIDTIDSAKRKKLARKMK